MITVIEYGNVFKVRCHNCESKLRFASNDVVSQQDYGSSMIYYITCPACREKIYLNEHKDISLILEGKNNEGKS